MAIKTWGDGTSPAPTFWNDGTGWTGDVKPAAGDDVIFDATYTGNCTINESTASLQSFTMGAGYTGTVSFSFGGALNVNNTPDGSHLIGTQGTLDCTVGPTIIVSGNWDTSSTNFTFIRGTSLINLTGTGTIAMRNTTTNALNNLTCAPAGKTTTLGSDIGIYGTLTVTAGTLVKDGYIIDGNNSGTLDVDGTLQDRNTGFSQSVAIKNMDIDVAGTYDHLNAWLIGCVGTGSGIVADDDKVVLESCEMTLITLKESALQDPVSSVSTPT